MSKSDSNQIGKKVIPNNELASLEPKMTFAQLIQLMSDVQDELYSRNLNEPAQLVHRALNRITTYSVNLKSVQLMETKKKDEAA